MSESSPHISVLVPAYNAAATLRRALDSVLAQTFTDFELIVCDDASADDTSRLLETVTDPRIRVLHNDTNKGIAATRNRLLQEARAPYIAWLDADDAMLPERLVRQLAYMQQHPDIDIASSYVWLQNYRDVKRRYPVHPECIRAMLVFKNILVQPAVISKNFYKTESIWYDEGCNYIEDYALWSRLLPLKRFGMVQEYLTAYTVPAGAQEHQKRLAYGWYANYDVLLAQRLSVMFNGLTLDKASLQVLSSFLRTATHLTRQQFETITSILNNLDKQPATAERKWLRVVLLYQHLRAARLYHTVLTFPLLFRFSPVIWWRMRQLMR